jgi:hypothetical protein
MDWQLILSLERNERLENQEKKMMRDLKNGGRGRGKLELEQKGCPILMGK